MIGIEFDSERMASGSSTEATLATELKLNLLIEESEQRARTQESRKQKPQAS